MTDDAACHRFRNLPPMNLYYYILSFLLSFVTKEKKKGIRRNTHITTYIYRNPCTMTHNRFFIRHHAAFPRHSPGKIIPGGGARVPAICHVLDGNFFNADRSDFLIVVVCSTGTCRYAGLSL
jgi:hypothetical protein